MKLLPRLTLTASLLGLLSPALSHAAEYRAVQADKSSIVFAYKQMGVNMDGKFKKFSAQLSFDPAKAAAGKATLDLDLASIDTGSSEANAEVAGKQWFNTKAFPTAQFVSDSIKSLGGNRYEVGGKLSIKGRTQSVAAPTVMTLIGNDARFDGSFVLKRADFAIGEGPWADFGTVANEIQIKFSILASATK